MTHACESQLAVHEARVSLYTAIADMLDSGLRPIDLATLRVLLESTQPPASLTVAWQAMRLLVDRLSEAASSPHDPASPIRADYRGYARDLRTIALCTDARREGLVRGASVSCAETGARCATGEQPGTLERLEVAAELLEHDDDPSCALLGRVLGWLLRDDPHTRKAPIMSPAGSMECEGELGREPEAAHDFGA